MNTSGKLQSSGYTIEVRNNRLILRPTGRWTLKTVGELDQRLSAELLSIGYGPVRGEEQNFDNVVFDFTALERIDTAGAYILTRAIGCHDGLCRMWEVVHAKPGQNELIRAAAEASKGMAPLPPPPWYEPLSRFGEGFMNALHEGYDTLVFFGQFVAVLFTLLLKPRRIRWKSVVAQTEIVGLDALPIIALLSFFIGAVIAFMGADLLSSFGAKVFVVDLVGISVLREFAVLITAILLAGRSNSSFTAEIGSMKMRQEIDAMTVIGLNKFETLVAPRALACLISAPILTFAAMLAGILGGLLVAWSQGISPILFSARLVEVTDIKHFWVGMSKAPVFAMVVAIVGCRQGLAVSGSVESLGRRTTESVVQSIFTVIVLDALFAMLFLRMGV